jgi:hypothetical protein
LHRECREEREREEQRQKQEKEYLRAIVAHPAAKREIEN